MSSHNPSQATHHTWHIKGTHARASLAPFPTAKLIDLGSKNICIGPHVHSCRAIPPGLDDNHLTIITIIILMIVLSYCC
jgi:hypothetical protein